MIVSKTINIPWSASTKGHYVGLGYSFTKLGDTFEVRIEHLKKGSDMKVEFVCDYCNGENQTQDSHKWKRFADLNKYRERSLTGKDCCNHKKCKVKKIEENNLLKPLDVGTSLAEKFPHLVKEWHSKNNRSPNHYTAKSHKSVWWICPKGHEYDMKISDRTHLGANCPYCAGKRVNETNSLSSLYPDVAKEWDYNKNPLEFNPENVSSMSNRRFWWKCDKGHEWEAVVNNRTGNENKCPYCQGYKVCLDNCFATTHPDLLKEWDFEKNTHCSPYEISQGNRMKVWWKGKCGHNWESALNSRTSKMRTGCPVCNESKGEKVVREFLEKHSVEFTPQYGFSELRGVGGLPLRFDFAVFNNGELLSLIEFDGEFHYRSIYSEDRYETLVEHDRRKNVYCIKNNINIIRIPYTRKEYIEDILKGYLTYIEINSDKTFQMVNPVL